MHRSLSSPNALLRRRIIGEELLMSNYRGFEWWCLTTRKTYRRERRHGSAPGFVVCHTYFSGVFANRRTTPKSPVSRSRIDATDRRLEANKDDVKSFHSSFRPKIFSLKITMISLCVQVEWLDRVESRQLIRLRHRIRRKKNGEELVKRIVLVFLDHS